MMQKQLEELSEFINTRMDQYPGVHRRYDATGRVFYYDLQPGDQTRYQFILAPLSDEMCKAFAVESGSYMVTFVLGGLMRSYPVNLQNLWDPGYLRGKLDLKDQYTHKALTVLLSYIADDINTLMELGA